MPYATRKQPRSSPGEQADNQKKSKKSEICPICTKEWINGTNIECAECNQNFHIKCIDMNQNYYKYLVEECEKSYYCHVCTADLIPNFPVMLEDMKSEMLKSMSDSFDRSVKNAMYSMNTKLTKMIEDKEAKLSGEIKKLNGEFRQLSEKFTSLQLNNTLSHRCNAMDRIENLSKRNNVVITGVPKLSGEDLKDVAVKIAAVSGHMMEVQEIEAAYRIHPKNPKPESYIAPIVVKFINIQNKIKFYNAYVNNCKSKRYITSNMLGFSTKHQIYVNHHMTTSIGFLFAKSIKLKKEKKFEAVSAKGNTIHIKVNGQWNKIKNETELNNIIAKL